MMEEREVYVYDSRGQHRCLHLGGGRGCISVTTKSDKMIVGDDDKESRCD